HPRHPPPFPTRRSSDLTGSGPFVFKKDEWKAGDTVVYVKFAQYRPRPEPPSGLAGGKVVKVDRVEWKAIADHQTAINALLSGERSEEHTSELQSLTNLV